MGFQMAPVADVPDSGNIQGLQKEIACGCWFTSTGKTMPKLIRAMDDDGCLHTIEVLDVVMSEKKWYAGIETVEHVCTVELNGAVKMVKLIFTKSTCTWKMVFL